MFWKKRHSDSGATPPPDPGGIAVRPVRRAAASIPELGKYLLGRGVVDNAQLGRALGRQRELAVKGRRERLGDILVDLKLSARAEVEAAAREQRDDFAAGWDD